MGYLDVFCKKWIFSADLGIGGSVGRVYLWFHALLVVPCDFITILATYCNIRLFGRLGDLDVCWKMLIIFHSPESIL